MKNYDPTKPSEYILYLGINNLHGWAVSGYLPYGGFKWLKNVDNCDINSISENTSTGYIFEVDIEYSDEFHVLHNDYPLAPKKLTISYNLFSDYCKKIADKYGIKVFQIWATKLIMYSITEIFSCICL